MPHAIQSSVAEHFVSGSHAGITINVCFYICLFYVYFALCWTLRLIDTFVLYMFCFGFFFLPSKAAGIYFLSFYFIRVDYLFVKTTKSHSHSMWQNLNFWCFINVDLVRPNETQIIFGFDKRCMSRSSTSHTYTTMTTTAAATWLSSSACYMPFQCKKCVCP